MDKDNDTYKGKNNDQDNDTGINNDNEKHFFEESNFSSYLAAINEDKKHFQCNFCNYAFSSNSE